MAEEIWLYGKIGRISGEKAVKYRTSGMAGNGKWVDGGKTVTS